MSSGKSRKSILGIIIVILVLAASVGGYYYYYLPSTKPKVPNPDTFVYEQFAEPDVLDPAIDYETHGGSIIEQVYESLVTYKGASVSEFVPMLATSWTVSPDGLVYTFKLRENVKFQDGNVMTAEDVKYSFDRVILINDPGGPAWILQSTIKGGPEYMVAKTYQVTNETEVQKYLAAGGVTVIDPLTVQFTLDHQFAPFISTLAFLGPAAVISKACVEAHGGLTPGFRNDWMLRHAECGTGAYKVVEWTPKSRIVLERFDDYWGGKPAIKRAIIQSVDEVGERVIALFAGDADGISMTAASMFDIVDKDAWLNEGKLVPLKKGLFVTAEPSLTITPALQMNLRMAPFNNKNFRLGMRYAMDYDTYLKVVNNGFGFRARGAIPKGMLGYAESLPLPEFNPAKAKEYFLTAKNEGAYKDGTVIPVYYEGGQEARGRGLLLLKDTIASLNVGFTLSVEPLDYTTFIAKMRAHELPMYFVGWAPDYVDPDNFAIAFYDGRKGYHAPRVGYNNEQVNQLIDQAAAETDPQKRAALYVEMQRIVDEDAIYVWTIQVMYPFVWRDWVHGYEPYNSAYASSERGFVPIKRITKDTQTDQVAIIIQNVLPPLVLMDLVPFTTRSKGA
jgi:peptide/nickel transport system substrate-binding protein